MHCSKTISVTVWYEYGYGDLRVRTIDCLVSIIPLVRTVQCLASSPDETIRRNHRIDQVRRTVRFVSSAGLNEPSKRSLNRAGSNGISPDDLSEKKPSDKRNDLVISRLATSKVGLLA